MRSMILAAGFGTRFRPVTYFLPKPLIPLNNKPLIGHAVEQYLAAGVDEIVVNLHHLPEVLERWLVDTYGDRFHFSHEEKILGTGGGIKKVRHLLQDDFFVVNGDTIQYPPYAELRRARGGALAALTLRHPPAGDKFTAVWFENGRVTGFREGTGEPLMFSGASCLSARILDLLPDDGDIVESVYIPAIRTGSDRLMGVIDDGPWFDIGSPRRYMQATEPNVVGARSVVEGLLENSVVWDDCRIGPNVKLTNCIVAHGVELDGAGELANALICTDHPAIPRDAPYEFRDGLVIAKI